MKNNENTVDDFKKGQNVIYVPAHAYPDWIKSEHCEFGVVRDVCTDFVYVCFLENEKLSKRANSCYPSSLVIQENIEEEIKAKEIRDSDPQSAY